MPSVWVVLGPLLPSGWTAHATHSRPPGASALRSLSTTWTASAWRKPLSGPVVNFSTTGGLGHLTFTSCAAVSRLLPRSPTPEALPTNVSAFCSTLPSLPSSPATLPSASPWCGPRPTSHDPQTRRPASKPSQPAALPLAPPSTASNQRRTAKLLPASARSPNGPLSGPSRPGPAHTPPSCTNTRSRNPPTATTTLYGRRLSARTWTLRRASSAVLALA